MAIRTTHSTAGLWLLAMALCAGCSNTVTPTAVAVAQRRTVAPTIAPTEAAPPHVDLVAFNQYYGYRYYECVAGDPDGDPVSVTLSLTADACRTDPSLCWSETKSFDRRVGDESVRFVRNGGDSHDGDTMPVLPPNGVLTCAVVDAHGATSVRSCRPTLTGGTGSCPGI